jgi:hypothetical protein
MRPWTPIVLTLLFGCPEPESAPPHSAEPPPATAEARDARQSFTRAPVDGSVQQIPDGRLLPDLVTPAVAVQSFQAQWDRYREEHRRGVVLTAGMDHHGVPIAATDPDPAHLPEGVPALISDPSQRDEATAYALCLGLLRHCAEATGSMDACVAAAPRCATDTPWNEGVACCAGPCLDGYRARRANGEAWTDAMLAALVDDHACHPGLASIFTEAPL